uniref:probable RNA polymerase II nuclear localization protein SLC7A6OS n=1 Tax=Ciona intestinalis TaxID=7719 RepID=UPI000052197E|nr:probable RNA polymerase II nuclear localization protein SLC7A6OS [Ciona intestinalis]|eukprot:XP_002127545.1 probable RNA polymerase II nuclear localization protein SLC7A6OS [Ciona intestinalis]
MATVIRVKRKRNAEPAEALLLACKRTKLNENFRGKSGMADIIQIEENVFHFAATVGASSSIDDGVTEKIQSAISTRNKLVSMYKPAVAASHPCKVLAGKLATQVKEEPPAKHKYKFISFCKGKEKSEGEKKRRRDSDPVSSSLCSKLFRHRANSSSDEEPKKPKSKKLTALLDVEENLVKNDTPPCDSDILCNTVAMLREKLTINPKKQAEDDFVYDLYYCQNTAKNWNVQDLLYVQPCRDLYLHIDPEWTDPDKLDDDDDSNDEDNWRNDYPDEEDSIDEDERRLLFDEEVDRYDSDDCEPCGREDETDAMAEAYLNGADPAQFDDNLDDLDYAEDLDNFDDVGFDSFNADAYDCYDNCQANDDDDGF